ncbi:MAG: hypothetical protein PHX18_00840 [Candidatus Gastranaerophilales bacterium]|nr:hypothetical protein [Candidatus Gastranaerophilales bacterium]
MLNNLSHKYFSNPIEREIKKLESLFIDDNSIFERNIRKFLEWNFNQEIPVIVEFRQGALEKLIKAFAGETLKQTTIGIAGETASGKTTITNEIINGLDEFARQNKYKNFITKINIDNYYYDRSEMVKAAGSFDRFVENYDLDCPEAFELDLLAAHLNFLKQGLAVYLPEYDMSGTAKRWDDKIFCTPAKIIISEGLFTFNEKIRDSFDLKIFVDIDEAVQKKRWYKRAMDRDLGESADRVYNNANEKARIYIRPAKEHADIVLNGEASIEQYKVFTNKIVDIIKEAKLNSREAELV